jgi:hypothetical protein
MTRLRVCCAVRVPSGYRVTPKMCHPPGPYLQDEQHVPALKEDRVHGEELFRKFLADSTRREVTSPDAFAGQPVGRLTRDEVLDNVAFTWLTNTGVSSAGGFCG